MPTFCQYFSQFVITLGPVDSGIGSFSGAQSKPAVIRFWQHRAEDSLAQRPDPLFQKSRQLPGEFFPWMETFKVHGYRYAEHAEPTVLAEGAMPNGYTPLFQVLMEDYDRLIDGDGLDCKQFCQDLIIS